VRSIDVTLVRFSVGYVSPLVDARTEAAPAIDVELVDSSILAMIFVPDAFAGLSDLKCLASIPFATVQSVFWLRPKVTLALMSTLGEVERLGIFVAAHSKDLETGDLFECQHMLYAGDQRS
jgi:hypothetical protein